MRAWLVLCAALVLAPGRPRAATATLAGPAADARPAHRQHNAAEPARLEHIKTQILAKLGLTTRPTPLGAPPRDVVRQILARAADTHTERPHEEEQSMREIIAIAHRV
ncbi:unnamed protein product, partial [Iphiclides podalirius]